MADEGYSSRRLSPPKMATGTTSSPLKRFTTVEQERQHPTTATQHQPPLPLPTPHPSFPIPTSSTAGISLIQSTTTCGRVDGCCSGHPFRDGHSFQGYAVNLAAAAADYAHELLSRI